MADLTFPTLSRRPSSMILELDDNVKFHESPADRSVQTVEKVGARWYLNVVYNEIEDNDARLLQAFFAQLRGRGGRFYMQDFTRLEPNGTALGSPVISSDTAPGDLSIATSGWSASQPLVLAAGDRIQFGEEYKMVTEDVSSDGSGLATVPVFPFVRNVNVATTQIITSSPKCRLMLINQKNGWIVRPPVLSTIRIMAREAYF